MYGAPPHNARTLPQDSLPSHRLAETASPGTTDSIRATTDFGLMLTGLLLLGFAAELGELFLLPDSGAFPFRPLDPRYLRSRSAFELAERIG